MSTSHDWSMSATRCWRSVSEDLARTNWLPRVVVLVLRGRCWSTSFFRSCGKVGVRLVLQCNKCGNIQGGGDGEVVHLECVSV